MKKNHVYIRMYTYGTLILENTFYAQKTYLYVVSQLNIMTSYTYVNSFIITDIYLPHYRQHIEFMDLLSSWCWMVVYMRSDEEKLWFWSGKRITGIVRWKMFWLGNECYVYWQNLWCYMWCDETGKCCWA